MNILMCFDQLARHFGPGRLAVALATAARERGHHVAVFVEQPVDADNQYAAALRTAGIAFYAPGRGARAADHWMQLNHLLLLALLPVRLPMALGDAALRRRTPARAWRGVYGRLNRRLPAARLAHPLRRALFAALDREHQRRPADLLHMMTGNGAAFDWAARRGLPIVYNENIVPSNDHGVEWWSDVVHHVDHIALTLAVCSAAVPAIRSVLGYRGPIAVVPSTVADPCSDGAGSAPRPAALAGTQVIGCAARLAAAKGVDVLLRAFRAVLERSGARPVQLWLAGDGPERAALETLAHELGVAPHVRFLGHREGRDMERFWAAIDLFALASRWEGLPLVLIEAMAHGKPVVATTVDGVPEAVVDAETGILIPPGAVEPLAVALAALLDDDERRAAMGRAGRARFVSTFRPEIVVDRLLDAYRQAVSHAG